MNILVLGGTGAMGSPLVNILVKQGYNVCVTSRKKRNSVDNLIYIQGDAKNINFLQTILNKTYDVIIDFMVYTTAEFEQRMELLLNKTGQYCFFSSSRVYAGETKIITEKSPRLLDICEDLEYIKTDEYALAKGRQEDLLCTSGKRNWTIIRPYITYNNYRLQLGVFEKENWLYRILQGRTLVFPKDIAKSVTTLTYGPDVAEVLVKLIGNEKALGEIFHIVNAKETMTWGEVLSVYLKVLEKKSGIKPKIVMTENSNLLQSVWNPWQIKYDRLFDREFSNEKICKVCGEYSFKSTSLGLEECLSAFLDKPLWTNINWKYEAAMDRLTGEKARLREIKEIIPKAKYLHWRFR